MIHEQEAKGLLPRPPKACGRWGLEGREEEKAQPLPSTHLVTLHHGKQSVDKLDLVVVVVHLLTRF